MRRSIFLILVFQPLIFAYHLGFFVPVDKSRKGNVDKNFGQAYAHALTIAINKLNSDPSILPGHNLTYSWTNSLDSENVLRAMYQKYILPPSPPTELNMTNATKPVDVFIGPAFNCTAPARVAQAFNIPMISYYCSEIKRFTKNEYPLFIQTFQNIHNQAASTLFALLKNQNWKRIGVIYEEGDAFWKGFLQKILTNAFFEKVIRMEVPFETKFGKYGQNFLEKPLCQERNESLAKVRDALNEMKKKHIKIIVVLTSFNVLIEVLSEAHGMGFTGTQRPHRAFIGFELVAKNRRMMYLEPEYNMFYSPFAEPAINVTFNAMKAARSLLIISTPDPANTQDYLEFRNELMQRTANQKPFRDDTIYDDATGDTSISERATALYDAVYQYGLALHRLHMKNITVTATNVVNEFRGHSYRGIGGYAATFTKDTGILRVHLSVLHLTEDVTWNDFNETLRSFSKRQPKVIGNFSLSEGNKSTPILKLNNKISWPWGTKRPTDQENCIDDDVGCPVEEKNAYVYIIPSVISVVFVIIFLVLIALFVRQWKRERELKRSVWQIDINQVIFDRKISTDSKFSDDSGIRTSSQELEEFALLDDCDTKDFFSNNNAIAEECPEIMSLQSFSAARITSGSYRGNRVFVKILPKNVDITKPMQREFRMLRRIHHENLNPFIGLGIENNYLWIVMQLGSKGTLEEVLANPDITLDHRFILSLVYDIAKGMAFLHSSDIKSHGNLKSSNCIVDNRWVLKITDYGIPGIRSRQARYMGPGNEDKKFRDLLWKAPELLRETDPPLCGTKKGDVYSFSIILEEFHTLGSPYSNSATSARNIVDRIVDGEVPPYRPVVTHPIENAERLLSLMKDCWRECPEKRPSFHEIKYDVEGAMNRCGLKTDICDNMITLLENYSSELEHVVSQRTRQLRDEKQKTDALLDRMLPRSVAEQLKRGETVQAESFSNVTVYFSDIVQFTALCAESTPMQVVDMLNDLYLLFDDIIMDYNVYKVETIGDAYMVVSGLPMRNGKLHASEISCMALEILENVKKFKVGHKPTHELQIRIGIHTGPVVAGVVGMTMPRYCLFGDTVNTAARMESNGKELKIHVSESTRDVLDELGGFHLQKREGEVYLKGKGNCTTYWLLGASSDVPRCPRKLSKKAMKPLFQSTDSRKYSQPFRTRKKTQISFPRASVA